MEIISRKDAKAAGLEFYFTGNPCIRGHLSKRATNNGNCIDCRRAYRKENEGYIKEYTKQYRADNKDKIKEYNEQNKDHIKDYKRRHYIDNRDMLLKKQREYYKNNRDSVLDYQAKYYEDNKDDIIQYSKRYQMERKKKDPEYNMRFVMSRSLKRVVSKIKSQFKMDIVIQDVDYTPSDLVENLEGKFLDGMTWENHGDWHIDHRKPISKFINEGICDAKVINALDNLIPMWARDNIRKSGMELEEWLNAQGENSREYQTYSVFL